MQDVIKLGDAFELLKEVPDKSVDAIITDPPYGIGLSDWDKKIDWERFVGEVKRVLKSEGFFAFFGLGTSFFRWVLQVEDMGFNFLEHIVWVKRRMTPHGKERLMRAFENIAVFGRERKRFYKYTGRWDDVRLEGIRLGLVDIKSLEVWSYFVSKNNGKISLRNNSLNVPEYDRLFKPEDRIIDFYNINFSNVWSFGLDRDKRHPTAKPLKLCERLVELLTLPGHTVLDPFMGSGSIVVAAYKLHRHYIGFEMEEKYFKTAQKMLQETQVYLFDDI